MKFWLVVKINRKTGQQTLNLFLFLKSALKFAQYIIDNCGKWTPKPLDKNSTRTHAWECGDYYMIISPLGLQYYFWSFRRWLGEHYHSQNLNENKLGEIKGSILKHGRAWFRFRKHDYTGPAIAWEWCFKWRNWIGIQMNLFDGDCERDISFSLHLFFMSLYFSLESILSKKYGYPRHSWAHTWGITYFDDHFSIEIHNAQNDCFSCKGWKGWSKSLFVKDFLLGRNIYSKRDISTTNAIVPMPEGNYEAIVTIHEETWKRSRFPFIKTTRLGSSIEVSGGLPVPGKGENSWDCGEDAIYSTGSYEPTISGAVSALVKSALHTRERYGGKDWAPSVRV